VVDIFCIFTKRVPNQYGIMKIITRNILLILLASIATISCKKKQTCSTCHIVSQFSWAATSPPAPVYYDTIVCGSAVSIFEGPDYNHNVVTYSGACGCSAYDVVSCSCN